MKAEYTIKLTRPAQEQVSVAWVTRDGTAKAGIDYRSASGVVVFKPGQTHQKIQIDILERSTQLARSFDVLLTGASNAEILDDSGTCLIKPKGVIGPLIKNGLVTNAFHNVEGRGGYFHEYSGTSEGQTVAIEAAFLAYVALKDADQVTAEWYRTLGVSLLDSIGDGSRVGPMLRQPFPTSSDTLTLLHWLFAARGDVPTQSIAYSYEATVSNGKLVIEDEDVYRVWMIYPSTSNLLFDNPYSPAYDAANPSGETQVLISENNWGAEAKRAVITVPGGQTGAWKIVYGYGNAGILAQGQAFEAYPSWTKLPDGYAACAPDTFRWFDLAVNLAIQHDPRASKIAQWTLFRDALRRTAVRGQAISDLREVFKRVPGVPALPAKGEPSGMFCYSNHPAATPPPAGMNQAWSGYNFWSRETDGSILATVPDADAAYQVQFGRGFNDEWRIATDYQDEDQFLWVSLSANNVMAGGHVFAYLSSTKFYDGDTRWYADLTTLPAWASVATSFAAGNVVDLYVPRTAFVRKDTDSEVLPAGTRLENFGLSIEFDGAYKVRMRDMRLVSANTESAKRGSKMPYFPGSMPFAINADTITQQFVGWNGSPFHGYQLPDLWLNLEAEADIVHPGLQAADLSVAETETGALFFPIVPTVNGGFKPKAALLMEQQLLFLKHAQDKWLSDSGASGPFAHTFVLNTAARMSIGNPRPHTWVYTNDDPNTRWAGYQARVAESLAKSAWLGRYKPGFQTCRDMSGEMALVWINWLNNYWPNLAGTLVDGKRIYGPPSDFPDPALSPVLTLAEDPHCAAIILRACLWLKQYKPSTAALCDAVMGRCWGYLELMWVQSGPMQYTWSPEPETGLWFGFWHFEIIATLSVLLVEPGRPASIPVSIVKERLALTYTWLKTNME
ncbi:hypothetical protein G3A39_40500 [Paraburkholderia aspalathi]|nr:hypothetical protein [Paraburkholderia aspalathi]